MNFDLRADYLLRCKCAFPVLISCVCFYHFVLEGSWIVIQLGYLLVYFWFKYNLGQKYYAPQVPSDHGLNL